MSVSRLFQSIIGITVGLIAVLSVVGFLGFLVLNGLSRNPSKPKFPEVVKDSSPTARPSSTIAPAIVTYQGGLVMRADPQSSAKAVATLDMNETVVVLGKSDDGQWQHIRSEGRGVTGWVSMGNVKTAP
jgi:Bacterial SH3 domain